MLTQLSQQLHRTLAGSDSPDDAKGCGLLPRGRFRERTSVYRCAVELEYPILEFDPDDHAVIRNSRVVVWPDAGHVGLIPRWSEVLAAFLSRFGASPV
jgi:hypothetical protein